MNRILFALLLVISINANAGKEPANVPYAYSSIINKLQTSQGPIMPGIALMGGGSDVDAAFQWMCHKSGNGDFLVLRASGTNAYNNYIKKLCPKLSSVATLIIPSIDAANHPDVLKYIANAEAIFIAGGDQSNYITFWKGTLTQWTLNEHMGMSKPIGGTSAGMMVLTEFLYPAFSATGVTSSQALANPFNDYMSLDSEFVNIGSLTGIFGDSHFSTRDRMGRDLAFMCLINKTFHVKRPRAISIDEQTTLLIDETGNGIIKGNGNVYFLEATADPLVCEQGKPLTYQNVNVQRANATGSFSLNSWSGQGISTYSVTASSGVLRSTQTGGSPY